MNNMEKLENAIGEIMAYIEENERIDRLTREKLNQKVSSLWNITGDMKEENEKNYERLQQVLKSL